MNRSAGHAGYGFSRFRVVVQISTTRASCTVTWTCPKSRPRSWRAISSRTAGLAAAVPVTGSAIDLHLSRDFGANAKRLPSWEPPVVRSATPLFSGATRVHTKSMDFVNFYEDGAIRSFLHTRRLDP